MATQFGGQSYSNGHVTYMPHGWKNFIKALIPMKGGDDTPQANR